MKVRLLLTAFIVFLYALNANAQQILRSTLSVSGCSIVSEDESNSYYVLQSFGDQGLVGTTTVDKFDISQGFIQYLIGTNMTQENIEQLAVSIYPNPVKTTLSIIIGEQIQENLNVSIYNMQGKKLYEKDFSAKNEIQIKTDFLEKGLYVIFLKSGNKFNYSNIIKQ